MSKLIRLMADAMTRLPSGKEMTFKVELHPDPCPRCGGKQSVNQVQDVRPDLPEAQCLDFDCHLKGLRAGG